MASVAVAPALEAKTRPSFRVLPSHCDLFLAALAVWLFAQGAGWGRLLMDGDTGWHIRTGEYILASGAVPHQDLFSYSRPGAEWYAWEWLCDVLFALVHGSFGIAGIAVLCGAAILATAGLLLRGMARSGANSFLSLGLAILWVGAASVHFHGRPHVFTMLFLAIAAALVRHDLRHGGKRIWLLIPLAALWTNLHGGFLVLLALLGLTAAGLAAEKLLHRQPSWNPAVRYAALTAGCGLATLINPYGLSLHSHIADYMRSDFIASAVQEFQSPSFRSEGALQFELLLFAALACSVLAVRRGSVAAVLPILFFAHSSLQAARHIPLFAILALPLVAEELTRLWNSWVQQYSPRSVLRTLDAVARDAGASFGRLTAWSAAGLAATVLLTPAALWPTDFSPERFPRELVARNRTLLTETRLLTSDQWGDYLIYRHYPQMRVYIDGRSDFYGEKMGRDYIALMDLQPRWKEVFSRNRFDAVLAPREWPLNAMLRSDPQWRLADSDSQGFLYVKVPALTQASNLMLGASAVEGSK